MNVKVMKYVILVLVASVMSADVHGATASVCTPRSLHALLTDDYEKTSGDVSSPSGYWRKRATPRIDRPVVVLELLEPLSRTGFRFLAIETAWRGDKINERGYPTANTGYCINDVVFAEVICAAISLNYEIVAYEIEDHQREEQKNMDIRFQEEKYII